MGDTPADILEQTEALPLMDPPCLTALRRVVSGAFTPKRVAQLEDRIGAEANKIVDDFVERGGGDVVEDFARRLPLWTICEILGLPEPLRAQLAPAAEALIAAEDQLDEGRTENGGTVALKAGMDLHRMARRVIKDRRSNPGDDILSALVHSELEGEPLSDQVLRNIFSLFITAGNDTTRNTTSQALKLFSDHPDQWSRLLGEPDLLASAVEEMVRCATPVIRFGRTAQADTVLAGVDIAEGDAVTIFYESANRERGSLSGSKPLRYHAEPQSPRRIRRGRTTFLPGASLARAELRGLFSRLTERVASIEAGEPRYIVSNFFNGIKGMPVKVVAA